MIDVDLPDGSFSGSLVVRQFAACLASVTEVPASELPLPEATDLTGALATWRGWLAGRGAGLVPIANPERFHWPGYWIAVVGGSTDVEPAAQAAALMFGTPAGVVLSPGDPALLGRAATDLPVQRGFVVASLEPALAVPATTAGGRGRV